MPGRLHLRRRADTLHPPGECAGCGTGEPVRPVEVIFCEDDVPGQWAQFTTENVRFFEQLGSPGGAAKTSPLPYDTELPRQLRHRPLTASWPGPPRRQAP